MTLHDWHNSEDDELPFLLELLAILWLGIVCAVLWLVRPVGRLIDWMYDRSKR